MMAALGQFAFGLSTVAYQQLQRRTSWKHRGSSRVGARDSNQFLGPGEDSITLSGLSVPELTGSRLSLGVIRDMADAGESYVFVDGAGYVYGSFVIKELTEGQTIQTALGVARRIEFSIQLERVDDDLLSSTIPKEGAKA